MEVKNKVAKYAPIINKNPDKPSRNNAIKNAVKTIIDPTSGWSKIKIIGNKRVAKALALEIVFLKLNPGEFNFKNTISKAKAFATLLFPIILILLQPDNWK